MPRFGSWPGTEIFDIDTERLQGDTDYAERLIKSLFQVVSECLDPFTAQRLFALVAPPLEAREMQFYENVVLYWKLVSMKPSPDIAELARQLSGKDGEDAMRKKIERARDNPRVRECLISILQDKLSYPPDTTLWP